MEEMDLNEQLRCRALFLHNLKDLDPKTRCKWCNKSVEQLAKESGIEIIN